MRKLLLLFLLLLSRLVGFLFTLKRERALTGGMKRCCNFSDNAHGGFLAWLIDVCSSMPLVLLQGPVMWQVRLLAFAW